MQKLTAFMSIKSAGLYFELGCYLYSPTLEQYPYSSIPFIIEGN